MKTERKSEMTKITASLFAPMYVDFDKQLSATLLRRDAFLDRMIATEISHLRKDLIGKKMSSKAKKYVSQSLMKMGADKLRQVSINIRKETVTALNEAVEAHNLDRNAFINWLIALLRSSDKLLERLGLPTRISDFNFRRIGLEDMATSPLKSIEEIQCDPFYYLRSACENIHECGLYALPLPTQLHGFSCYLSDEDVPGTLANEEKIAKENEMIAALGDFEASISSIK
jgi:hypothetical protein